MLCSWLREVSRRTTWILGLAVTAWAGSTASGQDVSLSADILADSSAATLAPVGEGIPPTQPVAPLVVDESVSTLSAPADAPAYFPYSYPPRRPQLYRTELEYLMWWAGNVEMPELLRSNPGTDDISAVGDASLPTTQTLIGHQPSGDWPQSGVRLRLARDLPRLAFSRFEFTGFVLFERDDVFSFASSAELPTLSRPFVNAITGLPDSQVVSFPGVAEGEMTVEYQRRAYGFDPLLTVCLPVGGCDTWESMFGYRFLRYEDRLRINERIVIGGGGLVGQGTEVLIHDEYRARNDYHVFPLGIHFASRTDCWQLDLRGLVSFGFVHQELEIRGSTRTTVGGFVAETSSGFSAQSNIVGVHDRTEFAWIPEVSLVMRRQMRDGVWVHAGYSVLYLSDIIQATDQYSPSIDPNLLAPINTAQPAAYELDSSDEWLHGLNFGITWHF